MPKRIVAEGDSWFALSKKSKRPIVSFTDVLSELGKILDNQNNRVYSIDSVSDISDRLGSMAYSKDQFDRFKSLFNIPPHAVLLSGGGNDITKKALETMLNDKRSNSYSSQSPPNPLNGKSVDSVINGFLREAYLKLLNKINNLCESNFKLKNKLPVLVHGYAYPVPDGEDFGWDFIPGLPGPWLEPALEHRGYFSLNEKFCIMQTIIDRFYYMLEGIDSNKDRFNNIFVKIVDLRSCWKTNLQNESYKKYWDDELHPSEDGFKLIARKFHKVIKNLPTIPAD